MLLKSVGPTETIIGWICGEVNGAWEKGNGARRCDKADVTRGQRPKRAEILDKFAAEVIMKTEKGAADKRPA